MQYTMLALALLLWLPLSAQQYWVNMYDPLPDLIYPGDYCPEDIIVCADGGYAVSGDVTLAYHWKYTYVMRLDESGEMLWTSREHVFDEDFIGNRCFMQTGDGGFLCAHSTLSLGAYFLKLAADGTQQWVEQIDNCAINCMAPLADGSFVCAGRIHIDGDSYSLVVRYNADCEEIWRDVLSMEDTQVEEIKGMVVSNYPAPESGLLVIGQIGSSGGNYIVKLDMDGNVHWTSSLYNAPLSRAYDVCEGQDGEVFASIAYLDDDNNPIATIEKLSPDGEYLDGYEFPSDEGTPMYLHNIIPGKTAGTIVGVGPTSSDTGFAIVQVNELESTAWRQTYDSYCLARGDKMLAETPDGGYVLAGYGEGEVLPQPIVMKTNASGAVGVDEHPAYVAPKLVAFPNPFNPETTVRFALAQPGHVRLDVYDIRGRRVTTLAEKNYQAGEHGVVWRADGAASGVYFARLVTGAGVSTTKLLLMK